jgi:hypothetical protein
MRYPAARTNRAAARPSALNLLGLSATMGYCWWCGKWSQVRNALCAECQARRGRAHQPGVGDPPSPR